MFTEASRTFQDIYGKNLRKASTSLHQLSSLFVSVKPWSFAYLVYSDFKLENGCTASRIFSVLPQLLSHNDASPLRCGIQGLPPCPSLSIRSICSSKSKVDEEPIGAKAPRSNVRGEATSFEGTDQSDFGRKGQTCLL